MLPRPCARPGCVKHLPVTARRHAKYCSGACRVAAHRLEVIPAELRGLPRWVRWMGRKIPRTVNGGMASSTDPATWSSYREAKRSTVGVGLGFVLNGDGIVCLDLDHCVGPDGALSEGADVLVRLAGDTYIEVSPSGHGLHIWGYAPGLQCGRRVTFRGQPVEVYPSGRYMTVTGRPFAGFERPLGDVSALVGAVVT